MKDYKVSQERKCRRKSSIIREWSDDNRPVKQGSHI